MNYSQANEIILYFILTYPNSSRGTILEALIAAFKTNSTASKNKLYKNTAMSQSNVRGKCY